MIARATSTEQHRRVFSREPAAEAALDELLRRRPSILDNSKIQMYFGIMNTLSVALRVADETWIATALLHRESPDSEDFTVQEIVERARRENMFGSLRPGVYIHANTHNVANRPPSPAGNRMLYETGPGRRRLFREADHAHPKRQGKTMPRRDQIPEQYRHLLDWYEAEYAPGAKEKWLSGIFAMAGAGKETFADENPDEYVRRLREGWE